MMRSIGPKLLILLVLAGLAGFAWMTRHPESPWIEEAQEWPVVGELARKFRIAYLGREAVQGGPENLSEEAVPPGSEPTATRRSAANVRTPPVRSTPTAVEQEMQASSSTVTEPIRLSGPIAAEESVSSSFRPPVRRSAPGAAAPAPAPAPIAYKALEWGWRLPGQPVLAAADSAAEVVGVLDTMAYLPVLAREGRWAEVRYRDRQGWIDTFWEAPHKRRGAGRGVLRHRLEPVKASDGTRLREARKRFGLREAEIDLGAYTLFTDVEDEELLDFLAGAAAAAEDAYFARYGRLPSGDPLRSAVLFADEADFRSYQGEGGLVAGNVGHAGRGILAFYAEGRPRVDLARTLVHEITHLLNARALAWNLPPWLEEGLASDLGAVWVESSPEVISDPAVADLGSFVVQGLEVRLLLLEALRTNGQLPSLATLLTLDRAGFYGASLATYPMSAAFIRYLIDGEDGALAEGFYTFLKRIAAGMRADLLKLVDRDVAALDEGFRRWLEVEARAGQERMKQRAEQYLAGRGVHISGSD